MKQRILACLTAAVMAISLFITPIGSLAQGLTQATDGSKVATLTISADDQIILKGMFDLNYYRSNNPDLAALKDNELFKHFCEHGIFEGRTCNAYFDPSAYASAYPALKAQFGNDIMAYFRHYAENKNNPDFAIATLEACANAKITVTSLADESIVIPPDLYKFAKNKNLDEFKIARALWLASLTGQPVESEGIVVTPDDVDPVLLRAMGMTPLRTISMAGTNGNIEYTIWVMADNDGSGAAIYDSDFCEGCEDYHIYSGRIIASTPDYSGYGYRIGEVVLSMTSYDAIRGELAGLQVSGVPSSGNMVMVKGTDWGNNVLTSSQTSVTEGNSYTAVLTNGTNTQEVQITGDPNGTVNTG